MRDPVADILAERSATGSGLAGAIVVSLFLHATGGALAVYAALRHPPPRPVSTINIRFAQTPRVAPPAPAPPQPVAPRIEEPRPQPVTPPPAKAAEPPTKDTAPLSPFGRSTKKGVDAPAPPPPPPPPSIPATGTAGTAGEIAVGETGVTALEGGDFPYTLYLEQMKRLIGTRWVRPPVGSGARTVVYFRIERDGMIRDVQVMARSGSGNFDRAAERAVLEASPLPALPFGYSGHYLGVHLTFR
ncbi:MAG TPA: energy transducer TonB [Thermoanaerobaculia bacterium]|nr:energy transducer TonB [Thermoanaerobaculia bacterium]